MTNQEIKDTIKEIIRIKALREKETELRAKVISELKKRRKDKLQLGGTDFVKISDVVTTLYSPYDLFKLMKEQRCKDFMIGPVVRAFIKDFCDMVAISKKQTPVALLEKLDPIETNTHQKLSYKVSLDDNNSVRGIDL